MTEPLRGSAAFSPISATTMILPHQVVRNLTSSAIGRTRLLQFLILGKAIVPKGKNTVEIK
jgi:hypothetical protein